MQHLRSSRGGGVNALDRRNLDGTAWGAMAASEIRIDAVSSPHFVICDDIEGERLVNGAIGEGALHSVDLHRQGDRGS